ncbi:MAG: NmrA family NAD(P)-binding protein, partial [Solirubrobacterales bacterium]
MFLVTGATGNVGGELVRALAGAGEPVRALIRQDSDRSKRTTSPAWSCGSQRATPSPTSPWRRSTPFDVAAISAAALTSGE